MSPLKLIILIHYSWSGNDYNTLHSPVRQDAICYLLNNGYLISDDDLHRTYKPTQKAFFYVEALCNLPEPEQTWIIPEVSE